MWLLTTAAFLVASALSGSAWSAGSLIVFRVLQGFALISPGVALLIYGLSRAVVSGVSSSGFLLPGGVGVLLLVGYVGHAWHSRQEPLIDLRLFSNRRFAMCAVVLFFLGFTVNSGLFLVPVQGHLVAGTTDLEAGLLVAPQGLGALVILPFVGRLVDRYGARLVASAGMATAAAATFAYAQLDAGTSPWMLAFWMLVRGIGTGATFAPALGSAYQIIEERIAGRATSALYVVLQLGGAIGTAGLALVLAERVAALVPGEVVDTSVPTFNPANAVEMAEAFNQTFLVGAIVCIVAAVAALFIPGRYRPEAEISNVGSPRRGPGEGPQTNVYAS